MKQVLDLDSKGNKEKRLFLDGPLGLPTTDYKYPVFQKLWNEQISFFWRPDEISVAKDASDILTMSDTERFIFENNLSFQTLGDSFLGSSIDEIISHVSNQELKDTLTVHSFFESQIHTPSYAHVIRNLYTDPVERLKSITTDPEIRKRASESTNRFNKLLNNDNSDTRVDILNTLVGLLALEGISFYNSFLTSFYFAKNGKMTGTGSIIKLIRRDERIHKANSINILRILDKEESEGFFDLKDYLYHIVPVTFKEMAEQEFNWIDYLMSKGELPGLTAKLLKQYVKYLTNKTQQELGLEIPPVFAKTNNPFTWVESFIGSSKSTQVAPQEMEIVNYVKSSKNDLDDFQF